MLQHSISYPFRITFTSLIFIAFFASCDIEPLNIDRDPENGNDENFSHNKSPGTSAMEFLRNDDFTNLLVEVQYMPGYRPTDVALDELRKYLEKHLNKSSIIISDPEEIPPGNQEQYSASEIRAIEKQYRRHFSEESTLTSYNLFVDGEYSTQSNVIGIAYFNTSNAYFGRTIHDASESPPLSPTREKIEGTVLQHEYGHLLGLVNSGTKMQENHQENGPHCTVEECLMYYTTNTSDFFTNLFDGTIPDLDEYCIADIQAAKE